MWFKKSGKDNDIVLSSRVRLARNLADYPFVNKLSDSQRKEIISKLREKFSEIDGWEFVDFSAIPEYKRASMAEAHIVSREFALDKSPTALIKNEEKSVYIMVLEEDHLRIQCVYPGLSLDEGLKSVFEAEDIIDEGFEIAFDEKLGYLTHCPSNLGTGMRASVMLHLPELTRSGAMKALIPQLSGVGLTVRGMNGEGSNVQASVYQLSNQVTLGVSESESLERLSSVVNKIIEKERELRGMIDGDRLFDLTDSVMRSVGTLMYACKISSSELMSIYSTLRLGTSLKIVEIPPQLLDEMLVRTMPNTICADNDCLLSSSERDKKRADTARRILGLSTQKIFHSISE